MANPLETLLNQTLPRFLGQELANVRSEARYEMEKEEGQRRYIKEWNRNETRYQDSIRRQEKADDIENDSMLIQQGSLIKNLQKQKDYFRQLIDTGGLKSVRGLDLVGSRNKLLGDQISTAVDQIKTLGNIGIEQYYVDQAKNFYMQGNDVAAFNVIDNQLRNKFKDPQTLAQSQLFLTNIKSDQTALNKLIGVTGEGFGEERLRLQKRISKNENEFRKLYELKTPFDPDALLTSFGTTLKTGLTDAGINIADKNEFQRILGATGDYNEIIQAYENKYIKGADASKFTEQQRGDEITKILNSIVEKEKTILPPIPKSGGWENMIPTAGQAGAGYLAWQLTKEPIKKAGKFISDKSVSAARHVKWVTGLPGQDIVKFLDEAALDTPGKPGAMMQKLEKFLNEIDELSGEKMDAENKAKMAKLKRQVDDQVGKIKNRFRKIGVSKKMKDADLEKLIRNPNKWRLAGVKKHMIKLRPKAAGAIRGWGVFSAAQKIGEALGDPTEGVATGVGTAGAIKGINSLIKKKGSKWTYNKLAPFIGKSLAKRVAGGAVAGFAAGPVGSVVTTTTGAALTIWDIYNFLKEEE